MFDDASSDGSAGSAVVLRPGRPATDDEVWEHDAWVASMAAELAGVPDETTVSGVTHLDGGPELAGWLAAVDVGVLGEYDVVEVVAGYERVASWAKARAAQAAADLAGRPSMNPHWPAHAGKVAEPCTASTELSLRLGVSRQAAARLVETGKALEGPLRQTGEALGCGAIDWFKAVTVVESLDRVPWQVAVEVEAMVLPTAPGRTHTQLRRDLERALAEVDPQDAQERHGRAVQRRRVERPRVLPDGMASVRAVIPAEAAVRLDATLQAAAVGARAGGDGRTIDQLRADALDAMAEVAWSTGWIGEGRPSSVRVGPARGRRAQVMVTVGIGTLLGLDERPAELAGYGPVGADVARCLAQEGTWRRLLVDPATGVALDVGRTRYRPPEGMAELVRARNPHWVVPTCSVAASQCDLDHTIPFGGGLLPRHTIPAVGADPLGCGPPDDPSSAGGAAVDDVALGIGHPGDRGDGPGGPGGPGGRGGPGDRGGTGETAVHNLGPLCRAHHLVKTHGGFRLSRRGDGTFTLRTPTGHRYLEVPPRTPGTPGPPRPTESPSAHDVDHGGVERRDGGTGGGTGRPPPF